MYLICSPTVNTIQSESLNMYTCIQESVFTVIYLVNKQNNLYFLVLKLELNLARQSFNIPI